jgi:putative transposase
MLCLQAFQYELRPNGQQERQMRRFAGARRFVFNKALALQKSLYEAGRKKLNYAGLCRELTSWRHSAETPWLADAPVHPLQQALKDLERAYTNFFDKRAAFPRFAKKGQADSFRYPDPKQFKLDQGNGRIFLPKLGWIRYRNSRMATGTPRNVTVSRRGEKWFIAVQTEREVTDPGPRAQSIVGVDRGISKCGALSDGTFIASLHPSAGAARKLARLQRQMSRKIKFSSNWKKAKLAITRLHIRIANMRRDFLHKSSTWLSQNHACVVLEDLQVKNMSRSAKGTAQQPGRNVRAKAGLNRSILDQGWGEFARQVSYKLAWSGGLALFVPAAHTSQKCSACGHVHQDNRKGEHFRCLVCGFAMDADTNAAINIEAAGHAVLACGEMAQSGRSVKQEPAEATQALAALAQ